MLALSLTRSYPAIRWINIVAAVLLFRFNLAGLPPTQGCTISS